MEQQKEKYIHDFKDKTLKSLDIFEITEKSSKIIDDSKIEMRSKAAKISPKRSKKHRRKVKLKKYTRIQKAYFKHKLKGTNICRKLSFHKNETMNAHHNGQNQGLFNLSPISTTISRTRLLRNILTKENLSRDKPVAEAISFESYSSRSTLTRENSILSDETSDTNNSVIEMPMINKSNVSSHKIMEVEHNLKENKIRNLYKSDVIEVAAARINNRSILDKNDQLNTTKRKNIYRENLTSAESFISQCDTSVSFTDSSQEDRNSSITLIGALPSDESTTFIITSPFSDKLDSDKTLRNSTENVLKPTIENSIHNQKPELLDTIINMGMFPVTSQCNKNVNNVLVSGPNEKVDTKTLDVPSRETFLKNITQKSFNTENSGNPQRFVLPNENTIKEVLTEIEQAQKRPCSEESRNYTPMTGLWEKMLILIDITMKRMEDSLIEKVGKEMRDVLSKFEYFKPESESKSQTRLKLRDVEKQSTKKYSDENLQCALIQTEIIDEMLSKIYNNERFKYITMKDLNGDIKESLEVIKPPIPCTSMDRGKESITLERFERSMIKYRFLTFPLRFVRENMFVIVSVPVFCLGLFTIYSCLVLLRMIW